MLTSTKIGIRLAPEGGVFPVHFDLVHAAVSGALILLALQALRAFGLRREDRKWDWNVFLAVFVVMAVLNLIWPFGSP